jgi:tRNA-specific 2-thiouridylase
MSGQNRITETYMPDKGARKDKVVVGLAGGIDSFVTAYLLKIQRYDLVGVTIVPAFEELGAGLFSCALSDKKIETIAAFCHQLGIPHHVVRIPREFKETVVEKWVGTKAAGQYPDQCWSCHNLRMEYLHRKMKEVGGKFLATGHFAKIFRQDPDSITLVQTSNDEQFDQSALLSRLPDSVLRDLMLPLSDLQKKEVLKLAENFGILDEQKTVRMFQCLPENEETLNYLKRQLPARFWKEGGIFGDNDDRLRDHEGVIRFTMGSAVLTDEERKTFYFTQYLPKESKIIVRDKEWFLRSRFVLRNCNVSAETPWHAPFKGIVMKEGKTVDAWIYPRTLNSCEVVLEEAHSLVEGEIVSVTKKKGKNSRVLLSGSVRFIKEAEAQGEEHVPVDYSRDF